MDDEITPNNFDELKEIATSLRAVNEEYRARLRRQKRENEELKTKYEILRQHLEDVTKFLENDVCAVAEFFNCTQGALKLCRLPGLDSSPATARLPKQLTSSPKPGSSTAAQLPEPQISIIKPKNVKNLQLDRINLNDIRRATENDETYNYSNVGGELSTILEEDSLVDREAAHTVASLSCQGIASVLRKGSPVNSESSVSSEMSVATSSSRSEYLGPEDESHVSQVEAMSRLGLVPSPGIIDPKNRRNEMYINFTRGSRSGSPKKEPFTPDCTNGSIGQGVSAGKSVLELVVALKREVLTPTNKTSVFSRTDGAVEDSSGNSAVAKKKKRITKPKKSVITPSEGKPAKRAKNLTDTTPKICKEEIDSLVKTPRPKRKAREAVTSLKEESLRHKIRRN